MMIRCGTDIVYVPDVARIMRHGPTLEKFVHANELTDTSLEHVAGVIAAKEAFFKALGLRPKFQDVQVAYEPSGRPKLVVAPQWQTFKECDVSISHDKDYAIAMVVLELKQ